MSDTPLSPLPQPDATVTDPIAASAPGAAVVVPMPPLTRLRHMIAFALSAILSPYLVLPIGTLIIIGSVAARTQDFVRYTAISVGFSTILPALYVIVQTLRGKITDIHIMDRTQRGGPFLVAILSSALGALVLHRVGAPMQVWGISAVLTLNGVILTWITTFWKISMHVAVLSATVFAAIIMIPQTPWLTLLALIPLLMWARITRGRHTIWQGIAGAAIAGVITGLSLGTLYFIYNAEWHDLVLRTLGLGTRR